MGIASPPEEERETDKDGSGGRRLSEGHAGVNGTAGSSSASEARPETEEKERRTHVVFSGDGERVTTPVRQEERASSEEEKSVRGPPAATSVPRLATEGDTTVSEEVASKSKRKQELTLDLGLTASSSKQPCDRPADPLDASAENVAATTSESGLIWQRVNMGTGDVQKKRQAFEQQIKSQGRVHHCHLLWSVISNLLPLLWNFACNNDIVALRHGTKTDCK